MASRLKKGGQMRVERIRHDKATRKNIPTAELEPFAAEAERKPMKVRYPRDPDLDPQLVWKGKDEQDSQDLEVPAVPIYIQEKIQSQALIEELRAESRGEVEPQVGLWGDFDGLQFEQLVEFYQHSQHWSNRLILGDSLMVMTSLAEKEGLKGQVQMIYVDPPYGIKFGSNWQVSTRRREVHDGKPEDATREPEVVRAFRDTWEKGIHSYLSYLRDRLLAARDLLTESGSLFIQIGDENVHLVRSLLDEVFGSENFISQILYRRGGFQTAEALPNTFDYILWYAKDRTNVKFRPLYLPADPQDWFTNQQRWIELPDGRREAHEGGTIPAGARLHSHRAAYSASGTSTSRFPVLVGGQEFLPPAGRGWSTNPEGFERLAAADRLLPLGNSLRFKPYYEDFPYRVLTNGWTDTVTSGFGERKIYVVQTGTMIVQRCMLMSTDTGDLVLDPTCGSGTTAYVAEQWGRRWITIDTSRVALALARTRLMAARFLFYLLADSEAGIKKEAEITGQVPPSPLPKTENDVRKGFIYKRVPHVTLKSIAHNPDIREGMTRREIDAAIARHAEQELLYDQPYEDPKIVRVSGPFTVESLSPHRVLAAEQNGAARPDDGDSGRFVSVILENLKKAGVQNTVKNERLVFEGLDPWPGARIQATGEYQESGKTRTAAICIGPEFGTVGQELVREAAKEAVKFADLLVVCGFAFDPHVGDETSRLGRLTILKAKMNPDLSLGDEILKKTGAANLFMVFGEPDIDIRKTKDDMVTVEIRGVDVYDPTTGVIRNHSTDDIATWFIDTNYDGESFFVRHAYFLGGDDPYEKLRRALRADVDEAAWQTLYSTKSRPFKRPATGKIALKVINHYGDEILKVFEV